MLRVLFVIHDLGPGGAENVLVNLVNNMDSRKFDITVMSLFDVGVNRSRLAPHVKYIGCFKHMIPGNSHLMKLLPAALWHKLLVREHYDVEVAYLEGPSTRIISGCRSKDTRLISWVHCTFHDNRDYTRGFTGKKETDRAYQRMDRVVCVSESIRDAFITFSGIRETCEVVHNTVESDLILQKAEEPVELDMPADLVKLAAVGTLKEVKGFDRLFRIMKRLHEEKVPCRLYLIGDGPLKKELLRYIEENDLEDVITMVGFQRNPYKYVQKCDLFVCSSYSEGFSTAATEALIVGTPVCTVEVSGMKEMLGENNEYGIVTENNEDELYAAVCRLIQSPELLEHYRVQAEARGRRFSTAQTVKEAETLFTGQV